MAELGTEVRFPIWFLKEKPDLKFAGFLCFQAPSLQLKMGFSLCDFVVDFLMKLLFIQLLEL